MLLKPMNRYFQDTKRGEIPQTILDKVALSDYEVYGVIFKIEMLNGEANDGLRDTKGTDLNLDYPASLSNMFSEYRSSFQCRGIHQSSGEIYDNGEYGFTMDTRDQCDRAKGVAFPSEDIFSTWG